jgi:homoserine O-acetyltransferase/O-succinyltransferase
MFASPFVNRSRFFSRSRRVFRGICLLSVVFSVVSMLRAQDGQQKIAELGQCRLESGQVISQCRVGYRTFGQLNAAGDNAILMPTWLYGKSADLQPYFGDGSSSQHLIDTGKFFGIAIDSLGNGVSSSPSNSQSQRATAFPAYTLRDSVAAQYRVMTEVLHLKHLHAVVGLSMGGEQTFVWAVMHPEFFDLAVPILGTPRPTSYDLFVKRIQADSIETDPGYNNGQYTKEPDLRLANLIGALVVTTPENVNRQVPRETMPEFLKRVEAPVPIDANDRVWQLRAIMKQDVIGHRTLAEAARAATARFLIIVSGEDHLVNPQPALDWAAAINAPTYVSHGACAHIIMSCDADAVSTRVREFLLKGKL